MMIVELLSNELMSNELLSSINKSIKLLCKTFSIVDQRLRRFSIEFVDDNVRSRNLEAFDDVSSMKKAFFDVTISRLTDEKKTCWLLIIQSM